MSDFIDTDSYGAGDGTPDIYDDVMLHPNGYQGGDILFETPEGDYLEANDTDGDGMADQIVGYLNGIGGVILVDQGMNGAEAVGIDTSGDGVSDVLITPQDDGTYFVETDRDLNGSFENSQIFTADDLAGLSPELLAAINGSLDDGVVTDPGTVDDYPVAVPIYNEEDGWIDGYDTDGDGQLDTLAGYLNAVGELTVLDWGMDGAEQVQIDTNGDGAPDMLIMPQADGTYIVSYDDNCDGVITERSECWTADDLAALSPELWAMVEGTADDGLVTETVEPPVEETPVDECPPVVDGQIVGDPSMYSDIWFEQSWNGSCVPASVAQIYSLYTGEAVSDLDFVELTNQIQGQGGTGGWVVGPDGAPGLPPATAADLLEAAGIPAVATYGSLDSLTTALAGGYGVMVAIDSGEVWYGEDVEDGAMDHMVVVTAIDYTTNTVYLSDTGSPDGAMEEVPLDIFLDAWADSENMMIECTVSVDEYQTGTTTEETYTETGQADAAAGASGASDDGVKPYSAVVETVVQHNDWLLLPVRLSL